MKFAFNLVLISFLTLLGFSAHQKHLYCDDLKSQQYQKRQDILRSLRDKCEDVTGPGCLNYVFELGMKLGQFDEQVLKSEGCE